MGGRDPRHGSGAGSVASGDSGGPAPERPARFVHERSERERYQHGPSGQGNYRPGGYGFGGPGILGAFGTLTGPAGIIIVAASALIGTVVTVVTRHDPGNLLGVVILAGTVVACLAVRARSVRLLIPAPTLSYVPAALLAGAINDRALDTTHTADALNAGSWIANGFLMMTLATIVAIVFTALRLLLDRRYRPQSRRHPGPRPVAEGSDVPRRAGPKPLDLDKTRPAGPGGWDQTSPIGPASATGPYAPQGTGPYRQDTGPIRPQDPGQRRPQDTAPRRSQDTAPRRPQDTAPRRSQDTAQRQPQGSGPYQAQDTGAYRAQDRRPVRREIAGPSRPQGSGPQQGQESGPYRSQPSGPYQAQDPYPSGPYPEPADLPSRWRALPGAARAFPGGRRTAAGA